MPRFGYIALDTFLKAFGIPNWRMEKIAAMSEYKWRRMFALYGSVANRIDGGVALFNHVIRCVLQLEIRGMSPSALPTIVYSQRRQ